MVINNTPANYSSVNGDLIYTTYDATKAVDPVAYQNYKYVCDVYVGGTLVTRLKAFPNPVNNRGQFNIGRAVRNYISFQSNPSANFKAQEFGAGEFNLSVQCKFGEEYGGTIYPNVVNDSARLFYNHYNGRLTSSETNLSAYLDNTATNRPYQNYCRLGGGKCYIPYFPSTTGNISVTCNYFNAAGTSLGSASSHINATTAKNLLIIDMSPTGVNQLLGGTFTITSAVAYYVITIGSNIYRIDLYCEPKYTPYTLHFLNQFGGFESFDFRKVSRKTIDFEKKTFQAQDYHIDASGVSSIRTSNNVMYDGLTSFAVSFKEKMKLYSDIMSDAEYTWLSQLFLSPLVYFDDGGYLVPINITATNYEFKKVINDKITSLMVEIDFGKQLNTQYR